MGPKIRIKLRGYDHRSLDTSAAKIVDTVRRSGAANPHSSLHRDSRAVQAQRQPRAL